MGLNDFQHIIIYFNLGIDISYFNFYFRLQAGAPSYKIVVGVATYGRTWKLNSDSEISGVPPIHAEGPGEAGNHFVFVSMLKKTWYVIVIFQ